jgi:hypothetical protein
LKANRNQLRGWFEAQRQSLRVWAEDSVAIGFVKNPFSPTH